MRECTCSERRDIHISGHFLWLGHHWRSFNWRLNQTHKHTGPLLKWGWEYGVYDKGQRPINLCQIRLKRLQSCLTLQADLDSLMLHMVLCTWRIFSPLWEMFKFTAGYLSSTTNTASQTATLSLCFDIRLLLRTAAFLSPWEQCFPMPTLGWGPFKIIIESD